MSPSVSPQCAILENILTYCQTITREYIFHDLHIPVPKITPACLPKPLPDLHHYPLQTRQPKPTSRHHAVLPNTICSPAPGSRSALEFPPQVIQSLRQKPQMPDLRSPLDSQRPNNLQARQATHGQRSLSHQFPLQRYEPTPQPRNQLRRHDRERCL